jgi:hypothetical protein
LERTTVSTACPQRAEVGRLDLPGVGPAGHRVAGLVRGAGPSQVAATVPAASGVREIKSHREITRASSQSTPSLNQPDHSAFPRIPEGSIVPNGEVCT